MRRFDHETVNRGYSEYSEMVPTAEGDYVLYDDAANWKARAEKAEARLAAMKRDAERYRWLRDASNLTLRTDGSTWTRADGNKFVSTHFLAVGDTQYGPCKSLDAAIDAARNRHD